MAAPTITPTSRIEMLTAASRGLGKVDLYGKRGVTMLSMDEIEAMALTLAALGLVPTPPGEAAPAVLFNPLQRGVK